MDLVSAATTLNNPCQGTLHHVTLPSYGLFSVTKLTAWRLTCLVPGNWTLV